MLEGGGEGGLMVFGRMLHSGDRPNFHLFRTRSRSESREKAKRVKGGYSSRISNELDRNTDGMLHYKGLEVKNGIREIGTVRVQGGGGADGKGQEKTSGISYFEELYLKEGRIRVSAVDSRVNEKRVMGGERNSFGDLQKGVRISI